MEAEVGIEPTNEAFAEPCLTTWLPRPTLASLVCCLKRLKRKYNALGKSWGQPYHTGC
jgi:hypothetical protein